MGNFFIAVDGDNVGQKLDYYTFINSVDELRSFSQNFLEKMNWLQDELKDKLEAEIIFCGGDNLMVRLPPSVTSRDLLKNMLTKIFMDFENVGNTLSAGIGNSPRDSAIALKFAKSSGKNCIKFYGDFTNAEE